MGLALADGQGVVVVGLAAQALGHELLARHLAHGRQHPLVADIPGGQLLVHHALARGGVVVGPLDRQGQEQQQQTGQQHPREHHFPPRAGPWPRRPSPPPAYLLSWHPARPVFKTKAGVGGE